MNYKTISKLFCLAVAILALPQTAQADDTSMFTLGGASKKGGWPATVVFALDTSGSMLFHNCEDCFQNNSGTYSTKTVTNSAKICINNKFEKLVGPDLNGDGVRDHYSPVYDRNNGTTWHGPHYQPLLSVDNGDTNTTYRSCSIWYPNVHSSYKDVGPIHNPSSCGRGTGSTNEKAIFDQEIKNYCKAYSGCEKRNRCVFSLRTYGYYYEGCRGETGDPYGTCSCYATGNKTPSCGNKITDGVFTKSDSTTTSGTKKNPAYLGDWMNFNPRRDHAVASALYSLIDELDDDIRVGYASYRDIPANGVSKTNASNYLHYTAKSSFQETKNVKPTCPTVNSTPACKDGEPETACFQSYKEQFKKEIFDFTGEYGVGTPTAETMDHIGIFASKAAGGDTSLFCDKCQNNAFMIVLTDGVPSGTCDTPNPRPNCETSTIRVCDTEEIKTPVYKTETTETTTCVDRQHWVTVECDPYPNDRPELKKVREDNDCTAVTEQNWKNKVKDIVREECESNGPTYRVKLDDDKVLTQLGKENVCELDKNKEGSNKLYI